MRLLVTRPEPDATQFADRLRALGHETVAEPLSAVELSPQDVPSLDGAQALIVTSRNALRALAASNQLGYAASKPLFAVGPATAALAMDLGFDEVVEGSGSAPDLLPKIIGSCPPSHGPLAYLHGEHIAFKMAEALEKTGFSLIRGVVYRVTTSQALSDGVQDIIRSGDVDGVVLMSPLAASTYDRLVEIHGLRTAARSIIHFCLSKMVAQRLSDQRKLDVKVSLEANSQEILALIEREAARSA